MNITRHCMPRRNSRSERRKRAVRLAVVVLISLGICCGAMIVLVAIVGAGQ